VRTWETVPKPNFVKIRSRGYTPFGQIYTKKHQFRQFLEGYSHIFFNPVTKFGMRVRTWGSLLQAIFCKNRLRGIPLLSKFIPNITNFRDFGGVSPYFNSENGEIWPESKDLEYPPPALNFVKIANGDLSLGEIFTKNSKFSQFLATLTLISIPIMLKFYYGERTDLGIQQRNKFSSKSLKGPAGIALPLGGDAY